jgi:hypothetical protein
MSKLIESIGSAGGPPTPEQAATMQALREKQAQYSTWLAILLALAVVGMSTAEYVIF